MKRAVVGAVLTAVLAPIGVDVARPQDPPLERPARINFHARFWNKVPGWEPEPEDYAYILFLPGSEISRITEARSGEGLGHVPAEHRLLISPSIKGLDQVLSQLSAAGFRLGALGYDLEGWEETPIEERTNPPAACERGQALAAQYGLPFFVGPTSNYSDQWGTRIVPFIAEYQSQDKDRQSRTWQEAVAHQRPLFQQLRSVNPEVILWHDMAIKPKNVAKPLSDLVDYYYALSDMAGGIGIWAMGSDEEMLKQFVLTVRPPATPPAGDTSPVITSGPSASPDDTEPGQAVTFTASAFDPDGDALTFSWDFGDHAAWGDGRRLVRGATATHAYSAAGIYRATVTVTDGRGGSARAAVDVTVGGGGGDCAAGVPAGHWHGEYFANRTLTGPPAMVRDDGTGELGFDWGAAGPSSECGVGADDFSARWTRSAGFPAGIYRFTVTTDDGARLYVDDVLKIDRWIDRAAGSDSVDVALAAGEHTIRMEYYENAGLATATLSWAAVGSTGPVIVDDGDAGFVLGGPPQYWHREAMGFGNDMYWTYTNGNVVSNLVRWRPQLPGAGTYRVEAFVPGRHATTLSAWYRIAAGGKAYWVRVNQNRYFDQWVDLGSYAFLGTNDGGEYVELTDATGEPVMSRRIGFDAVRFSRQGNGVVAP